MNCQHRISQSFGCFIHSPSSTVILLNLEILNQILYFIHRCRLFSFHFKCLVGISYQLIILHFNYLCVTCLFLPLNSVQETYFSGLQPYFKHIFFDCLKIRMRTIYLYNRFSLKFQNGYGVCISHEESHRAQQPKQCENNNQDELPTLTKGIEQW